MDPFTIAAGALGITDFAISSIDYLHNSITGLAEAKDVVEDVASNLKAIQCSLIALGELRISDNIIYTLAKQDLEKAGVPEAVNNCGEACDSFAKKLEQWTKHSSGTKFSLKDRFRVGVWNKEKIRTLRTQVQTCQSTVQFAVQSTQLIIQVRSESAFTTDREEVKRQLLAFEKAVREHIDGIIVEQGEAQKRKKELEEEPEAEEDGGAQQTLAVKEVEQQLSLLEKHQASSAFLVTQLQRERRRQNIRDVKASDDSTAVAGLINISGEQLLIDQDISGVTASTRSFAGAGVINNLDFGSLH